MARLNNQASYNIITGEEENSNARRPLRETFKQSNATVAPRTDNNTENLRAQLNTLQYELDALKQERELTELRHSQELHEARSRAEADFKRAQNAESAATLAKNKADALAREAQDIQATAINEKAQLEKKVRTLQDESRSLREDLDEAQAELATSVRQSSHSTAELQQKYATLQASVESLQSDLQGRVSALQSTQQKLVIKEREVGELENEVLKLKAQTGDADTLSLIKSELSEQVAYIKKLETTNSDQAAEIKQFRKRQKGIEVVEEEKRGLEARVRMMDDLRRELAEVQLHKRILEDEKRGWTSYLETEASSEEDMQYETPEQMAKAFLHERIERLSLLDKLGAVQPELTVKEDNIRSLEDEKARLQAELEQLRNAASTAPTTAPDNKARLRLERQKNLVTKEVEYLRAQMKTLEAEEAEFKPEQVDEERQKRIHELEDLVEQYRTELESAHSELSKLEVQPATIVQTPRKRSREEDDDSNERLGELRRKARTLQDDLDKLQTRNQFLEAELKANVLQITSLKETSRTRVLEFRNNPTAVTEAIKMSTLKTLKEENAALLAQLEGRPNGTKVVPISTLDNVRGQLEEMQSILAGAEKKQDRLKKIWGSKSLEFREAVCSILGWKLDFMPNGRVKATSILYPTSIHNGEEEENSIVFDGENGTMKVSGGPKSIFASEIRELIEFWVEGRKEIPCFLAACTLEFYDRSTKAQRM